MSNPFSNILSTVEQGVFGASGSPANILKSTARQLLNNDLVKDWQHANILFTNNNYALAPKLDFLYYVTFNVNPNIKLPSSVKMTGKLVKDFSLPELKIQTKTLNAYNRPNVIQTKVDYGELHLTLHDDSDDNSLSLWWNYFQYYYGDSFMLTNSQKPLVPKNVTSSLDSTYSPIQNAWQYHNDISSGSMAASLNSPDYYWGYGNNGSKVKKSNAIQYHFFDSIKVYIFHQKDYTCYHIYNPKITNFKQSGVKTDSTNGVMSIDLGLAYEGINCSFGSVAAPTSFDGDLSTMYESGYDTSASPLAPTAGGAKSITGQGGLLSSLSTIGSDMKSGNLLGAAVTAFRGANTWKGTTLGALGTMVGAEAVGTVKNFLSGQNNASIFNFAKGSTTQQISTFHIRTDSTKR